MAAARAAGLAAAAALVAATAAAAAAGAADSHAVSAPPPWRICDVRAFGAVGDNATEDTAALQAALDACSPGEVVLPAPGAYLSRPLNLTGRNDTALTIAAGATLVAWPDPDTWANRTGAFMPFLWHDGGFAAAGTLRNFTLSGGGVIDGQGWRWWPFLKSRPRPILLSFSNVDGLTLANLTLRDSPSWNTRLRGRNIEAGHMTVLANAGSCAGWQEAPNTDGFNIAGQNIYIHNSLVHNGDDCVPVFSWNGTDTANVTVERVDCHCGTNGVVVILADAACAEDSTGSIINVTARGMLVNGTNQAAGLKICEAYSLPHGVVARNVTWEDLVILNPRNAALYADVYEEDVNPAACALPGNASRTDWMRAEGFTFRNVTGVLAPGTLPGCFLCAPGSPCSGFAFEGVRFSRDDGSPAPAYGCFNVENVTSGGGTAPVPGCGA